jgi:peptidyl-prolyl cis-trans isomerase C
MPRKSRVIQFSGPRSTRRIDARLVRSPQTTLAGETIAAPTLIPLRARPHAGIVPVRIVPARVVPACVVPARVVSAGIVRVGGVLAGIAIAGLLALANCPPSRAAPGDATAPAAPPPPARPAPEILPDPGAIMRAMANELDKHPDQGVFVLETITITQGEMADVIRSMPPYLASLGYNEVSRRAIETLVAQKAMVLNALKLGLDKDATVIRKENALKDRALADAWLSRVGDEAVTDKALHAKYDETIAGKPGPTEVRARLILVPTEEQARSIIEEAQKGADFGDLAKQYSKDGSASKGGDLGYASRDAMSQEIGAVAFATNLGQVTPFPTATQAGWVVLRVEGRRQRATPSFEDAKPRLEAAVRSEAIANTIQAVLAHIKMAPVATPAKAK